MEGKQEKRPKSRDRDRSLFLAAVFTGTSMVTSYLDSLPLWPNLVLFPIFFVAFNFLLPLTRTKILLGRKN